MKQLITILRRAWKEDIPAKYLLIIAIAYFIVPIDVISDIIPFIGHMDDVSLFLLTSLFAYSRNRTETEKAQS
ncbi:YkvA family protein [Patescibacteria group bacterium]